MSSGAEPLRNRGELLWSWIGSCIEMNVEPKAERLCAVVSSKQRRLEVFALLEDISMDAAMRRHLSSSDVQCVCVHQCGGVSLCLFFECECLCICVHKSMCKRVCV